MGLPEHSHFSTNVFNSAIQRFLTPPLTTATIRREQALFKTFSMVYFQSKMDASDVHEKRNLFNLAIPLKIGQLVLQENKRMIQGVSFKLQPLQKGIFKVTKIVTEVTYEIEELDTGQKIVRHRNLLLPYYPKIQSVPHLITKFRLDNQIVHRGWKISPSDHDPFNQFTPDATDNLPPEVVPTLVPDLNESESSDDSSEELPQRTLTPRSNKPDQPGTSRDSTGYGSMLGDTTGAIPKTTLRRSDRIKYKKDETGETSGYLTPSKIPISPTLNVEDTDISFDISKTPKPKFSSTPKPRYDLRNKKLADNQDTLEKIEEISPVVEITNRGKNKSKKLQDEKVPETPKTTQRSSQRLKQQKNLKDKTNPEFKWFNHVYQKWDHMYDWQTPVQYNYYN